MKTDELIDRLGRGLRVARPLPAPGIRTAVWMVWAVSYLVVVAVMMFAVMSSDGVTPTPLYLVQQECGADHGDHGGTRRVLVGDSWLESSRVGGARDRGSGLGRVAVVGRRA